jgi:hypothetical protein
LKQARLYVITGLVAAGLLLPAPLRAQVHVEEEVSTDSVDLFNKNEGTEKSGAIAMLADLVLPGLGHYYFGNEKAACGFFAAEALFIFGTFACNQYSNEIGHSAHSFAFTHAEIQGGAGADDLYWQNIGKTLDSKGFNRIMDLNRASDDDKYLTPNLQWQWDDESSRLKYNAFLKKSVNYRVAANFFFGALILDRLVAFIDIRVASNHGGKGLLSSLHFYPDYSLSTGASGVTCVSNF